eukprot:CAMPEP_0174277474 /NCGR_PEP_ID=MMETSP0439-20130205/60951_1 /TAXON_ID=0 /ORGANISM="Stereomyxa ramosa, Strain Chinc5" /LENGTH=203 /DNA_ID=CAMNT_0015369797 /DNA_START=1318 /DNA_END=1926 /DNA_ORIENTATION=+
MTECLSELRDFYARKFKYVDSKKMQLVLSESNLLWKSDAGLKNRRPFISGDDHRLKGLVRGANLYLQNDNGYTGIITWRIHLFRLYKNILFYIPRSTFAKDKQVLRPIPLLDAIAYPDNENNCKFKLSHPFMTYDIIAANEMTRDEWVSLINKNRKHRTPRKQIVTKLPSKPESKTLCEINEEQVVEEFFKKDLSVSDLKLSW